MKESLLQYLRCPDCRAPFELKVQKGSADEIVSGRLQCRNCESTYPIEKGIPRILPDLDRTAYTYCKNYEYQWLTLDWHRPELTNRRFYELTKWRPEDIKGKAIMDAGCGGGRWVYEFAREGAGDVIAFDYTLAVERAREICSEFSNVHYVQTDIFKMPFSDDSMDIVHCHGVLHNLPEPLEGLRNLSAKVKPGGEIAFLVHRNLTPLQTIIDHSICWVTSRLPIPFMYYFSYLPTLIEYIPGALFLFENIFHLSAQPGFMRKHWHNFDWYTSKYKHRTSPQQAERWLRDLHFPDIKILDTNEFRIRSKYGKVREIKEKLLEKGFFLKATLGVRATKYSSSSQLDPA